METLGIIILIAAICNFFLGLLVFIKNPLSRINRLFGIFGFISSVWCFTNFIMVIQPSVFWLRSAYAFGALVPASAISWTLELCDKKITKFKIILIFSLGLLFFLIPFIDGLIITDIKNIYPGGFIEGETGLLFPLYAVYVSGAMGFIIYTLISEYPKTEGIRKMQLSYVLVGSFLYMSIVLMVSFILPLFGNMKFSNLDSPSSLIFLAFTALAITRYHLFEVKVILTEILVGIIAIISLIEALIFKTFWTQTLGFSVFILFCFIGYLLIKATHREIKAKEILEDKVKERTKELQTAYEDI